MIKATNSKRLSSMAVGIVICHFMKDTKNEINSNLANDEARCITTKKQSKSWEVKDY